jgi:hypothetical protein
MTAPSDPAEASPSWRVGRARPDATILNGFAPALLATALRVGARPQTSGREWSADPPRVQRDMRRHSAFMLGWTCSSVTGLGFAPGVVGGVCQFSAARARVRQRSAGSSPALRRGTATPTTRRYGPPRHLSARSAHFAKRCDAWRSVELGACPAAVARTREWYAPHAALACALASDASAHRKGADTSGQFGGPRSGDAHMVADSAALFSSGRVAGAWVCL